jgi:hypothetical protein
MHSSLSTRLGSHYLYGDPITPPPLELTLFKAWILKEFHAIPVPTTFHDRDIDLSEMLSTFADTGILQISIKNNVHPFLSPADNARFRAAHDWHHVVTGADSTLRGEITTYCHARKTADRRIWWMLHSEIIGQASACIATGEFPKQKLVKILAA